MICDRILLLIFYIVMAFIFLSLLMITLTDSFPTVDRYITELPSQLPWDYGMVADQPYIPSSPSSYIYQIEDPNANYIYSSEYWNKKDYGPFSKQKIYGMRSSNSTPTSRPNFRYRSAPSMTYTPVIRQHNDGYYGNVYTTPYEFSRFVVQPNVLYSGYLTKPVYVVNNAFNSVPSNIYQYPMVRYYIQQPFFDTPKIDHKITPNKKPVQTNLTQVNIDPINEARSSTYDRTFGNNGIVHKQRRVYNNPYGIFYHKIHLQ